MLQWKNQCWFIRYKKCWSVFYSFVNSKLLILNFEHFIHSHTHQWEFKIYYLGHQTRIKMNKWINCNFSFSFYGIWQAVVLLKRIVKCDVYDLTTMICLHDLIEDMVWCGVDVNVLPLNIEINKSHWKWA